MFGYLPTPAVAAAAITAGENGEKFLPPSGGVGERASERELDRLVAVGELVVEGGGESGGLEGGGQSDGRNFSVFRRGWGKSKRGL